MINQFYYKNNLLQQIRGFCYTVQTGSISEAAKKMNLSQAAVTLQIQSLERDLEIKLFTREKGRIKITKNGNEFYQQAIFYQQGIDSLISNFQETIKHEQHNVIDIGANHAIISYILPKYIAKFKKKNPDINLKIRNLSRDEGIARLLDDKIDFLIYPKDLVKKMPIEIEFIPIVNYQPILLITKDHPLAKKKTINLKDVKKYELVRIDPKLITLPAFEEIINAHGLQSKIEFEMSDWEILKKFVKAKIGVAIISNIILEGETDKDLIGIKLTNYFAEMQYGIMIKKGKILHEKLKDFVNLLTTEKLLQAQKNNSK